MKKNIISATMIGTVVNIFINGSYHQKDFQSTDAALEFLRMCQKAKTDDSLVDEIKNSLNKLHKVEAYGIFEKDALGNYFLKGTETSIPELLMTTIISYIDNKLEIEPLIKFWKLCLINPDKRVRADLFKFLSHYNFSITDEGMFIAYKTVTHKDKVDEDFIAFLSNQWLKVKKWKKSPKNYTVIVGIETESVEIERDEDEWDEENDEWMENDDEPEFEERETYSNKVVETVDLERLQAEGKVKSIHGNLEEMYQNIEKMLDEVDNTLYTDKHTQTMEIRVGLPVKQERKTCDKDPRQECSNGLHVGSTKYVKQFANSGDSFLACFVNPMNVIAVPEYDNSKMRVCEYFPFAKLERNADGTFETIESNYFETDYINMEQGDLEKLYNEMLKSENPLEYEADENVKEKIQLIKERLIQIAE